jgi:hypothetical protein
MADDGVVEWTMDDGVKLGPGDGLIVEWGRARPLTWEEYQHWMIQILPMGWSLLVAPTDPSAPIRR